MNHFFQLFAIFFARARSRFARASRKIQVFFSGHDGEGELPAAQPDAGRAQVRVQPLDTRGHLPEEGLTSPDALPPTSTWIGRDF